MDLTPQPPPYAEGGPPQSAIAPGDDLRELIHEIKNLNQQVRLLHTVFVRRKILFRFLLIEMIVIASLLATLFILTNENHTRENKLIIRLAGTCQIRNQQTLGTQQLITSVLGINREQINALPKAQLTPFVKHLEGEYVAALRKWQDSLPTPVDCAALGAT